MGSILSTTVNTIIDFYEDHKRVLNFAAGLYGFAAVITLINTAFLKTNIYISESLRCDETDGKKRYYITQYGQEHEIFPDEYGNIGRGNLGTNNIGFFNRGNGNYGIGNEGNNLTGIGW